MEKIKTIYVWENSGDFRPIKITKYDGIKFLEDELDNNVSYNQCLLFAKQNWGRIVSCTERSFRVPQH